MRPYLPFAFPPLLEIKHCGCRTNSLKNSAGLLRQKCLEELVVEIDGIHED